MTHYLLCKHGKTADAPHMFCLNHEHRLLLWISEEAAQAYADKQLYEKKWLVRLATPNDFAIVGRKPANSKNQTRPCYIIVDGKPAMAKKTVSSGTLVELYENYETRKFAISSRADSEREFCNEIAQVLSSTPTDDWQTRLKEVIPLIVDMACKYRGYKAESVVERRELIAGDLDMPKDNTK